MLIRRLVALPFLMVASLSAPSVEARVELFPVAEVRQGMKGYGLSVFEGTEPARFEIEVVGVLRRAFFDQDLVLVRMSGQRLETTNIIAGMSGSPVYLDNRLLGAVAYGWSFPKEPLAAVTPAEVMARQMERTPREAAARSRPPEPFRPEEPLTPLATPLWISGLSAANVAELTDELREWGLEPQLGLFALGTESAAEGSDRLVAGGSIGVPLVRGDWNAAAIGTVTFVSGDAVAAFGHPFFGFGPVDLPMYTSRVEEIFAGQSRSFKFGTILREVGAVRGDYNAAIVGFHGEKAGLVPVAIRLSKPEVSPQELYDIEVVDHPQLTPMFVGVALRNALEVGLPDFEEGVLECRVDIRLDTEERFEWSDRFDVDGAAMLPRAALGGLGELLGNPYRTVRLREAAFDLSFTPGRRRAEILRAFVSRPDAVPGEILPVHVVIEPFNAEALQQTLSVPIPADAAAGALLRIDIGSGSSMEPVAAPYENYAQLVRMVRLNYPNDQIVARVWMEGRGSVRAGMRLPNLPPIARERMEPSGSRRRPGSGAQRNYDHLFETPWILSGGASVTVEVRDAW